MQYMIVQKDTGYIDGFYQSRDQAEIVMKVWQRRYPDSEFESVSVAGNPKIIHDDSRYLPNVYNLEGE